ncbi:MAG TPA: hypothetical protein VFF68_00335 [Anaerolineaceae bacterium]|nr:hypothetical protein [Anaerolineaceae bacterium]
MTPNLSTFRIALGLLAHPASLAAMAVMLLNDLVLRRLVPSWWTGKLSDVAYLFFMPFVTAALLAWLVPGQGDRHERRVRRLAFAAVALAFTLGKLHPAINNSAADFIQSLLGLPVQITADPTDLLTLPVLGLAWLLWVRRPDLPRFSFPQPARWVLLPLAAFLTLANSAAPSAGITDLVAEGDRIFASGYFTTWSSADGGLTWQEGPKTSYSPFTNGEGDGAEKVLAIPDTEIRYRYDDRVIERSEDGGASWQADYEPAAFHEAERAYLEKTTSVNESYSPTPIDAVYDPASGNVIFSMGHRGVLVRLASGEWQWAAVGPHRHMALEQSGLAGYFTLLQGELVLAVAAALLVFSTLAWLLLEKKWHRTAKLIVGWLLFVAVAAVVPPAVTNQAYSNLIVNFGLLAAAIWTVLSAVLDAVSLSRLGRPSLGRTALFSLWALPAYLLPYLLWAARVLPYYYLAALLAAVILAVVLVLGRSRVAVSSER